MFPRLIIVVGVLISSFYALPAIAQSADTTELARTICKDQTGSAFNVCVRQQQQSFNCASLAPSQRLQCEERKRAARECAGLFGWAFRQCTQEKLSQPDCSTASDRKLCERNRSAATTCGNKTGEDHMNCLREHFRE